jgi:hypothetical protein
MVKGPTNGVSGSVERGGSTVGGAGAGGGSGETSKAVGSRPVYSRSVLASFVGSGGRGNRDDLLTAMKECGPTCKVFEVKVGALQA